jgi:hypothetical protein
MGSRLSLGGYSVDCFAIIAVTNMIVHAVTSAGSVN